jgi:4-hydroxy-4-methyl-2-oxoglutarate aldolase
MTVGDSKVSVNQYADTISALTAAGVGSADLHECLGRAGALPSRIKPLNPSWTVAGPALPVAFSGGDNLWLHRAIATAQPGEVLVALPSADVEAGYWGEIMSTAALGRDIAGLVIDGGVRDRTRLLALELPLFCTSLCIHGTTKAVDGPGSIGTAVAFGSSIVSIGDLVFGDADGVVVVPREQVQSVCAAAIERKRQEAEIIVRLRSGETTLTIYGLPDTPDRADIVDSLRVHAGEV